MRNFPTKQIIFLILKLCFSFYGEIKNCFFGLFFKIIIFLLLSKITRNYEMHLPQIDFHVSNQFCPFCRCMINISARGHFAQAQPVNNTTRDSTVQYIGSNVFVKKTKNYSYPCPKLSHIFSFHISYTSQNHFSLRKPIFTQHID